MRRVEAWLAGYAVAMPASAPVSSAPALVPVPVPATPAVEGDWHESVAYLGMAEAFGE